MEGESSRDAATKAINLHLYGSKPDNRGFHYELKENFPYASQLLLSIKSTPASVLIPTSASVLDSQTID